MTVMPLARSCSGARLAIVALMLVLVLPGTATASGGAPAVDATLAAELQAILDGAQRNRPIVGLAASVILPDGTRWDGGSGLLEDGAADKPMLASTPSVVGSITKTFVAALVLQLVREGRLRLRDPLSRWLPEFSFARHVRVRHLLRHTSGLRDYFRHPSYASLVFGRPTHHWTTDEILTLVQPRLGFTPGSRWQYSNTNFLFLGLIAEKLTGRSLAAELRARFFGPLGLAATALQGADVPPTEAAYGYIWKRSRFKGFADGSPFRTHTSAATVAWAAGAVASSARDVATWMRELYGGNVLNAASRAAMVRFNVHDYGLGTMRFSFDDVACWGHTGSLRGYTAIACHAPDSGITVALLTNRGRIDISGLAAELLRAAARSLAAPVAARAS